MKKILLFLLLSTFAFGQNIELLKKANASSDDFSTALAADMLPNYSLIDNYKQGAYNTYIYVPNVTSEQEIKDCRLGNKCSMKVSLRFKEVNSVYQFTDAKGSFQDLYPFWKKEVQPEAPDKSKESSAVYTYKNKDEKIWFNFWQTSSTWMIRNESDRSQPW